jgi:CBS domain-containing protein
MLLVRDVMTRGVVTISPDRAVKDAAGMLLEHGIGGLVVVDDAGVVRGVISESDFLPKGRGPSRRRHLGLVRRPSATKRAEHARITARTVADAMSSPAITIDADRPVAEAATRMLDRGVTRLPVMDNGRMVGIVSRSNLLRAFVVPDQRLAEDIRNDLIGRTMLLNPLSFDVDVTDGVVSIGGRVERRSMAEDLVRLAWTVPGVVAVDAALAWTVDDITRRAPRQVVPAPPSIR